MATLASFLQDLLFEGRIRFEAEPADADDAEALVVLRRAYGAYAASIAGPVLRLDHATALAAGRLTMRAAWYLLNANWPIEAPERTLRMPLKPSTPEQHLSADLVLRFLPAVQRRAEALLKDDVLPTELERTLREWPLSGVLADIDAPPLTALDFGAHAGVNFLYAERLAENERPGWFPQGIGMQYVELVWQQLGRDVTMLPALAALAHEMGTK